MYLRKAFLSVLTATVGILAASTAVGQEYPKNDKPINIIVPFAPGGASDILARLIGQKLSEAWGTNVIVQNKPGGDMVIALQQVARSDKDGYTIGLTTSSFALNKVAKKDFPMDPVTDFAFIGLIGQSPYLLSVNADSKYKTFKELENASREKNSNFSYASCCFGTYFSAEMIKSVTKLDGVHIPYKGSTPALNAILGKDVEYIIDTTTASKSFINSGKIRPLMVTTRKRSNALPDVPSLNDAGIPGDFDIGVWYGFTFPAGTPTEIVKKANSTLNKILAMPDVKAKIEGFDIEVTPSTPEKMSERVSKDLQMYTSATKSAKLNFGQ
ncbi:tripartite tricarboxylate transporter substrate binding protein [Polynucleobacter sp. MWH-HuK1]|uniref:Bug family tripartite tricarboxylate transporter substrate binding protein n=1 Tax=Polynucleobacter sp. MWH-HuK1 TaxID=1743158 RepID=UPI001C0E872C|nr:tripartite tricarboxylate transporter substrate-binding protein [Polynucleobacter sp. MWH-HuK1]MBU3565209.1 hypothetical protein [Polynucleobacter sp. MWH-HuK1]